jgi:hypothetical protein
MHGRPLIARRSLFAIVMLMEFHTGEEWTLVVASGLAYWTERKSFKMALWPALVGLFLVG